MPQKEETAPRAAQEELESEDNLSYFNPSDIEQQEQQENEEDSKYDSASSEQQEQQSVIVEPIYALPGIDGGTTQDA